MLTPRRDLPPPPPPAHLRGWLDPAAVRADRAAALGELGRRSIGIIRLLLLWLVAAVFAVGWSFLGSALTAFEDGGHGEVVIGLVFVLLGAGVLVPAGLWAAAAARHDRAVRRLQGAWAEVCRDPAVDARLRAPLRSLGWLLSSLLLCAAGLWLTFGATGSARPGMDTYGEMASAMGLGMILWVTGLLGAARAAAHYCWALRVAGAGAEATASGL